MPIELSELLSQALDEVEWTIEGILQKGTAMMLSAEPYTAKTWVLLDMSIAVAQGEEWMGRETTQGRVLIIDEEDSIGDLQRRFQQLLRGRELPVTGLGVDVCLLPLAGLNISDKKHKSALSVLLEKHKPDLVIIDSMVRIHRADENDATKMAQVSGTIKRLMVRHGCSIVLSHHDRKPTSRKGGPPENRFRGSSEIRAFVDSHLDLEKTAIEGRFRVHHVKIRAGRTLPAFDFELMDTSPKSTVVRHLGEATTEAKARQEKAKGLILKAASGGEWLSRKVLLERGDSEGISRDQMDSARKSLIADGEVVEEKRGKESGIILAQRSAETDTPKRTEGRSESDESGEESTTVETESSQQPDQSGKES